MELAKRWFLWLSRNITTSEEEDQGNEPIDEAGKLQDEANWWDHKWRWSFSDESWSALENGNSQLDSAAHATDKDERK